MTGPARYDDIADFYDDAVGDDLRDPTAAALLDMLPNLRGLRVCDIASGQGRLSRELARRGARVLGLDISAALLEKARSAENADPLGITYVEADASSPEALAGERFDGVVCHFGLSDIDNLDGAAATVSRVLRPDGWLAFSLLHPCFPGWGDDAPSSWPTGQGYFAEGWWLADNPGFRGKVGANHRMLSTYLNALVEHGLSIERAVEPRPAGEWLHAKPSEDLVPVFLVLFCRRVPWQTPIEAQ
jgi:SAM-dependent methyltransferase